MKLHYFEWGVHKQLPEMFYEKAVLKNFAMFTGEHFYYSFFFYKVADLQAHNFIKRDSNTVVFL